MGEIIAGYKIEDKILFVRGQKVILDADLAKLYGVPTMRLNEQVKRNRDRFPVDFMFRLTAIEKEEVIANCDNLGRLKFSPVSPRVFTEHGAIMAATVLNSAKAVEMSLFLVRAFVKMREVLAVKHLTEKRLDEIERTLMSHDSSLRDLYAKIRPLLLPSPEPPKRKIGFRADEKSVVYHVN